MEKVVFSLLIHLCTIFTTGEPSLPDNTKAVEQTTDHVISANIKTPQISGLRHKKQKTTTHKSLRQKAGAARAESAGKAVKQATAESGIGTNTEIIQIDNLPPKEQKIIMPELPEQTTSEAEAESSNATGEAETLSSKYISGIVENEDELLYKVFGSKRTQKDIMMEFTCLLDGEKVGEVMIMVGKEKKILAKSIKEVLSDYLLEEEIKKIDKAKDKNGFVSFNDLEFLELKPKFDMANLQLEISVPIRKKKIRSLGKIESSSYKEKPNVTPAVFSGFINTRISNTIHRASMYNSNDKAFILTPALNFYGVVLEGECSYYTSSDKSKKTFNRDYTSLVYDYQENNMIFRLGDVFSYSMDYQSVPQVLGFGLRKDSVENPGDRGFTNSVQITLLKKSTIEVYVNDILTKTKIDVAPGTYTLDDIPYSNGSNNVKIKIIDDSGRERFIDNTVFLDSSFVKEGCASYGVTFGYPKTNNRENERYDKKNSIIFGFIKYGLTNATEFSFGIQKNRIGESLSTGIRNINILGLIELKCASSLYEEKQKRIKGKVVQVSYVSPSFDIFSSSIRCGVSAEKADTFFYPYLSNLENIETESPNDFLNQRKNIKGRNSNVKYYLSLSDFCDMNLNFSYNIINSENKAKSFAMNVHKYISINNEIFSNAYVNLTFERVRFHEKNVERKLGLNCTISFKNDTALSYNCTHYKENTHTVSIRHNPRNKNWNHNINMTKGANYTSYSAGANYQHSRFRANLHHSKTDSRFSSNSTQIGLETGLFFADGAFAVSANHIYDDGFIIVKPSGALADENIKFLNKSSESGILGGAVLPIARNEITHSRLDLSELSDNMEIKEDTIVSYGSYRRGGLIEIFSEKSNTVAGILQDEQGDPIKLCSGFIINTTDQTVDPVIFFTNDDGRFIMNNIRPGKYKFSINVDGYDDFEINVPKVENQILNLGNIVCKSSGGTNE